MSEELTRDWTSIIESQVYSNVREDFSEELKTQFDMSNKNFTTEEESPKSPVFPTIYIHLLPMVEQGQDLKNTTINAVMATFQVEVTINTTKSDARLIMWEVVRIFKEMSFSIISMPETTNSGGIARAVMRARRLIGSGDAF